MSSLKTKVRNISGGSRFFSYLGSHGITLTAGQEYEENGDLVTKIANSKQNRRWFTALEADLSNSKLAIVSTVKDHFYDETTDETKVLQVDNGTVSVVDPTWGSYSSSM